MIKYSEHSTTRTERIKTWFSNAGIEEALMGGIAVASLALGTYGIVGGIKQDNDVKRS